MLSTAHYQRKGNQNYNEVSPHTGHHQKIWNQEMLERCGKKGTLLPCWWECKPIQLLWRTVWRFYEKLGIKRLIQLFHYWAYTLRKPKLKKTHVSQCSLQHNLQQPGHGSNLGVHQQMNGNRSCGIHTKWNITGP